MNSFVTLPMDKLKFQTQPVFYTITFSSPGLEGRAAFKRAT